MSNDMTQARLLREAITEFESNFTKRNAAREKRRLTMSKPGASEWLLVKWANFPVYSRGRMLRVGQATAVEKCGSWEAAERALIAMKCSKALLSIEEASCFAKHVNNCERPA